ncbi:MAG: DHHW family protein [Hespellia sp.]|nr:DHHW family protein [Hespellia sp.]
MEETQKKNRKRKLKIQGCVAMCFWACIGILAIGNVLVPNKKASDSENRSLTQRPRLTVSALQTGTFMQQYESYLSDQFVARDVWVNLSVSLGKLAGNRENNGIFLGKKNQLIEDVVTPDKEALQANLDAINTFAQTNPDIPVSMALVPTTASIWKDKLPALATVADQKTYIRSVQKKVGDQVAWIDAAAALEAHRDEKIFYKTDHHWTSLGAYYVFQGCGDALGIQSSTSTSFTPYAVSTSFNGVLSSESGYARNEKEEIDIYVPIGDDIEVIVNFVEEQKKRTSIYDSSKLETKDQYGVFLGGNSPLIDIKTTANSTRRLLVFKDSYANCFLPFLTPYFREIVVVDPRYYGGTAEDLLTTYNITDTLFLYNANTFFRDNNISGVLTGE